MKQVVCYKQYTKSIYVLATLFKKKKKKNKLLSPEPCSQDTAYKVITIIILISAPWQVKTKANNGKSMVGPLPIARDVMWKLLSVLVHIFLK